MSATVRDFAFEAEVREHLRRDLAQLERPDLVTPEEKAAMRRRIRRWMELGDEQEARRRAGNPTFTPDVLFELDGEE